MITTWQRYQHDRPRAIDAAMALVLFGASFPGSRVAVVNAAAPAHWWPAVVLDGVSCAALLWRRSHPRAVTALTAACAVVVAAMGYLPTVLLLGPLMVAAFTLADRTDRKTANTFTFVTLAVLIATGLRHGTAHQALELRAIAPAAYLLLPLALGTTARMRRDYLEAVRERADYAERNREQDAQHRVAEERMRIARDLHDVVAHHLALANAQATTAAHLATTRPEQAREILTQLTATTSSALRELKATVGLLRQGDDSDVPLHPAPGLAQLPELTASFAAVGLGVTVSTLGRAHPLAPAVDVTAFRIVQEALTNASKHAATKTAHVQLAYSRDRVTITVTNDADQKPTAFVHTGAGTGDSGGNFGLIGMRERAHAVGGALRAGRRAEGGFEVAADLPAIPPSPEEDIQP